MEAIDFLEKTKKICDYYFEQDARCNICPIMPFCMNAPDTIKDMEAYIEITEKCELKKTPEEFLEEFKSKIDIKDAISYISTVGYCGICPATKDCPKLDLVQHGVSYDSCKHTLIKYFGL